MFHLFTVALLLSGSVAVVLRDDPSDLEPLDQREDKQMAQKKIAMKHYEDGLYQHLLQESNPFLCPTLSTVTPFDLEAYISLPWYSQMQQPLLYNNVDTMKCVRADYRRQDNLSNGYEIEVYNQAVNVNTGEKKGCCGGGGTTAGSESLRLCSQQVDGGKLRVAPCNLSPDMAGPYWIVHYEEGEDGFVVVAGGDPYLPTLDQGREGGGWSCGYLFLLQNNAGLWFMSRKPIATDAVKEKAKGIIEKMGLAYSQMMPVDQSDCTYRTPEDR